MKSLRNFDFKQMNEFPLALQCVLIVLACAAVFYLAYLWDFTSVNKKFITNQRKEQDLKVQLQALANNAASLHSVIAQLPIVQQAIQEWRGKLIKGSELPDLLNEILKIGTANNLQFELFNPGAEVKEGPYYKVPIKTVILGTYQQIATFISQVANMSWVIAVNDFVIVKETAATTAEKDSAPSNRLKAELTLDVYHLGENKQ